jgi:hypothetical protein
MRVLCLLLFSAALFAKVDFDREVRPILSDLCFSCHGPDESRRMAGLRLDTKDGAFAVRGKNAVIVAGDAANSRLFQRMSHEQVARRMPPPQASRQATAKQVETIRQWINEGAEWRVHWAYQTPVRPELPAVKNEAWAKNPVDRFILARLEKEGLTPSPAADRAKLLRRVSLDLTGLPPTPAEVAAFVNDKSPGAYEKQVDRLLQSPHYGERMALPWLDLARYADSHGYHIDSHRDMWPWRDWVIRAFNANQPFDQFTIEQLAGDLLPNATKEQKIATGFNRNHMINFEGGAIPEEYHAEYVIDRVEATSTTFLAMTMGCARCHSHKYDPIAHKDFYRFFAFFNNVSDKGLDGREGNAVPNLPLPTPEQESMQKELKARIQAAEEYLKSEVVKQAQAAWEKQATGVPAQPVNEGLLAHYDFDGSLADQSGRYQHGRTVYGDPTFGTGLVARALGLDQQTRVELGTAIAPRFSIALWVRQGGSKQEMPLLQKLDGERSTVELVLDEQNLFAIQRREARLIVRIDGIEARTVGTFRQGEWKHVVVAYDGTGASGLRVFLDGELDPLTKRTGEARGEFPGVWTMGAREANRKAYAGSFDDLRIYGRALAEGEVKYLALDHPVRTIFSGVAGKRTKPEDDLVREYFLTRVAAEETRQRYADLKAWRKEYTKLEKQILNTMVMDEMAKPRESFVLNRGQYDQPGEKVTPGVPAVLPPLPDGAPANRLTLAKWLVDAKHPLTARVAVNRFWQMYFGLGIVKTAEDFGSQGDPPSHPELLDWLATEFIRTGWDVKAMQKLIVMSNTYQQSSRTTPALVERDPENRLLARGPRFRLPAELLRDQALAVSGLLNPALGGPSVFPYQPPGIWEELAFGDGFSMQEYVQSHGPDLYRRSMYTFWKRTAPPASMSTFDAPDREKCVAWRPVTNTPLQALVLWNDPTYLEAARALAARTWQAAGADVAKRASWAFTQALGRAPKPAELAVLTKLARAQSLQFAKNPQAAADLLKAGESPVPAGIPVPELAAWTVVSSAILNLDELVTKE